MYSRPHLNDINNTLAENPEKAVKIIKAHIAEAKQWVKEESERQSLIQEINKAMIMLFHFAHTNHMLEKLLRYFIKDIKSWLIPLRQTVNKSETEKNFLPPFLSECACIGNGIFNRFKNDMREKIEISVLDFVKNYIEKADSKEINYLSLGSGELLQDFIIINKILLLLADCGRKDLPVHITLVDPIYGDMTENLVQTGAQFEYLEELATELGIYFSLTIHPSMDAYLADLPKKQDIIMATDFDSFHTTAFKSTVKAHKILNEEGRMFLSVLRDRYILAKTQSLSPLPAVAYLNDFPLKTKKHIKIASLIERNIFTVYPMILPYIQQVKDCEMVTITLPHPQKIDQQGFWSGAKFPELSISSADLQYWFSLFLPNLNVTVNCVTGNKNFKKLLPQFSEDQDLVFCYDRQTADAFEDIAAVHKKFPNADVLFRMNTKENKTVEQQKIFSCSWIYNLTENSTTVIRGSDESMNILSDVYQKIVAENRAQLSS